MILAALLALVASSGTVGSRVCRCDMIEFNRIVRPDSDQFEQVIFWRWDHQRVRYEVRGWTLADRVDQVTPHSVTVHGWTVHTTTIRHTVTSYDPEQEDARRLLRSMREMMPWEHPRAKIVH